MRSQTTLTTICFLFCAKCFDQGYTLRRQVINLDGSMESGNNFTKILEILIKSLPKANIKIKDGKEPIFEYDEAYKGWDYFKKHMMEFFFGDNKKKETKASRAGSQLWEVAETLISDLATALADNPDEQAIVQPGLEKQKSTVLQDIRSGRVRGPVHVYGRHAYQDDDD